MRLIVLSTVVVAVVGTVAFLVLHDGGGHDASLRVSLDCGDQSALPDASPPASGAPTAERVSINAALVEVLSRWEAASYAADYEICRRAGGHDSGGRVRVFKDGPKRARADTELTLQGSRFAFSRVAIVDDAGARAAECSDNLGRYYKAKLGGFYDDTAKQYPEVQLDRSIFNLKAACVEQGFDEHRNAVDVAGHDGVFPARADDARRAPDSYAEFPAIRESTVAGSRVTCGEYGFFGRAREEYCFDDAGRLLTAARSGHDGVERMQLVGSPTTVTDGDFIPPLQVKSQQVCNTETAWDRATPRPLDDRATATSPSSPHDYREALSRYFRSAYTATYRACSSESDLFTVTTFTGQLIWFKGGLDRARVDLRPEGKTAASYYVRRGGDATLCSDDLTVYLKDEIGDESDHIAGQCMHDQERNSCGCTGYRHDFLDRVGVPDSLKINVVDFEDGAGNDYARQLPAAGRIYLNQTATCFAHRPGDEDCYSDSGVLLYSRHDDSVVEAVDLQPAPSHVDLTPPR